MREPLPPALSLRLGLVAAAATTGALVAIGHRLGSVVLPFAAIAAPVLGRTATSSDPGLAAWGVVLHVVVTIGWSVVFARLVGSSLRRANAAAAGIAALGFVAGWIVARTTNRGLATVLALGDRLVLAAIFAAALAIGIRFAFPREREDAALG